MILKYCGKCMQMTNHKGKICLKCKVMKMKQYKFVGDCLEFKIKGLELCDEKVHLTEKFWLAVELGMDVSVEQLKEFLKFNKGLKDEQYWELTLKPIRRKSKSKEICMR